MAWGGSERRRFLRVVFPCKVAVGSSLRWLASYAQNISAGGVKLILEERLNVSTTLKLELFLEKEKSIKCKGRVVWVKEIVNPLDMEERPVVFETGIEFTEIDDFDRNYLKNLAKVMSFLKEK